MREAAASTVPASRRVLSVSTRTGSFPSGGMSTCTSIPAFCSQYTFVVIRRPGAHETLDPEFRKGCADHAKNLIEGTTRQVCRSPAPAASHLPIPADEDPSRADPQNEHPELPRVARKMVAYEPRIVSAKSDRQAARESVAEFLEAQLAGLVEHVGSAVDRFRSGQMDAFDVDQVLFQYARAAKEL